MNWQELLFTKESIKYDQKNILPSISILMIIRLSRKIDIRSYIETLQKQFEFLLNSSQNYSFSSLIIYHTIRLY